MIVFHNIFAIFLSLYLMVNDVGQADVILINSTGEYVLPDPPSQFTHLLKPSPTIAPSGAADSTAVGTTVPHINNANIRRRPETTIMLILPETNFRYRWNRVVEDVQNVVAELRRDFRITRAVRLREPRIKFLDNSISPMAILELVCEILNENINTILYHSYFADSPSTRYFMQLTGFLQLPVIYWTPSSLADTDGLTLQMSPSIGHQVKAMTGIMLKYQWHQFAMIVADDMPSSSAFVAAAKEAVAESRDDVSDLLRSGAGGSGTDSALQLVLTMKLTAQDFASEQRLISQLRGTFDSNDVRIVMLHCSEEQARLVFRAANRTKMLGPEYVWLLSKEAVGETMMNGGAAGGVGSTGRSPMRIPDEYPAGIMGLYFEQTDVTLSLHAKLSAEIWQTAFESYVLSRPKSAVSDVYRPDAACQSAGNLRWHHGRDFYKFLRNVSLARPHHDPSVPSAQNPPSEFDSNGVYQRVMLQILNLQHVTGSPAEESVISSAGGSLYALTKPTTASRGGGAGSVTPATPTPTPAAAPSSPPKRWAHVGSWTPESGAEIHNIKWFSNSIVPPLGQPRMYSVSVMTLEEEPYVIISEKRFEARSCAETSGVKCLVWVVDNNATATTTEETEANVKKQPRRGQWQEKCCTGFCIDLLGELARDLHFNFTLRQIKNKKWGIRLPNGSWTGLPAELLNGHADIVLTSLKINKQRAESIDFSVPFLDTGIAIVVAKRKGIMRPTAFLEPYNYVVWLFILVISVHVVAAFIFLFEWMSPSGFNMHRGQMENTRKLGYDFSLCKTLWLVYGILFAANCRMTVPRGYTARYMSNVWAAASLVFIAIYTANLAAFMITKEDYDDLHGLDDPRVQQGARASPPLRFGTIDFGATAYTINAVYPHVYQYMKQFNQINVKQGVEATKNGKLDAFIYDATVLEYLVGRDKDCNILTVGSWYATTGYGVGACFRSWPPKDFGKSVIGLKIQIFAHTAFPPGSPWLPKFNLKILEYQKRGFLERLQAIWLRGACKEDERQDERRFSSALRIINVLSPFLLLMAGIVFSFFILVLEHIYVRYVRRRVTRATAGLSSIISQSGGTHMSLERAATQSWRVARRYHCRDALCHLRVEYLLRKLQQQQNYLERIYLKQPQLRQMESAMSGCFDGLDDVDGDEKSFLPNGRALQCFSPSADAEDIQDGALVVAPVFEKFTANGKREKNKEQGQQALLPAPKTAGRSEKYAPHYRIDEDEEEEFCEFETVL